MHAQPIRFFHRGTLQTVSDAPITRTVLQYLREDAHCTGTKEGCAEGDCGACTVVIAERDAHGDPQFKAVNACIQLLASLDGRALYTVEDLRAADGALHPVQQAMVDCHGSQCGFCTPGFVMSMWALYQKTSKDAVPTRTAINEALSGNLCRCTGYRPIVEATRKMHDYAPRFVDRDALRDRLADIRREHGAAFRGPDARGEDVGSAVFHAPTSLDDFATLYADRPQIRIVAGSTDIGLWITKQFRDIGDLLYAGNVAALKTIDVTQAPAPAPDGMATIGAAVSLQDAFAVLSDLYPPLNDLWQRFASLPIRNAGTLGGNVANGSPIGDSMPALIALGARVLLRYREQTRELPLEALYVAYQKTAMLPGEFVQAIRVPTHGSTHGSTQASTHVDSSTPSPMPTPPAFRFRAYKLAKRYDQDISAVFAGLSVTIDADRVVEARLAYGGMAATPRRARAAETALQGQPWTETPVRQAMAALAADFQPLSDMRASDRYRLRSAQQLLWRFYLETRDDRPLTPAQLNAFSAGPIGLEVQS